jgi:anti-sigma regulatory factor (Ser/Thr protein kinase)
MKQQIEVPGEWDSLATLMAFTDSVETRLPLSADQSYLMRLVIEEIATNIVKYGYSETARDVIQLTCFCDGDLLKIVIRDRGRPFDPREQADPDLSGDDASDRAIGGLGLFFVREMADHLEYHHDPASGWNELTVIKGKGC